MGHNSRTCLSNKGTRDLAYPSSSLRLFGIQIDTSSSSSASSSSSSSASLTINKSVGMDYLSSPIKATNASSSRGSADENSIQMLNGYFSDNLLRRNDYRRKGIAWSEEEHRRFLIGLEKLGKGDWRGISGSFVRTRSPTQVASHAQKYFLRKSSLNNKKKRHSRLFDVEEDQFSITIINSSDYEPNYASVSCGGFSTNYGTMLDLSSLHKDDTNHAEMSHYPVEVTVQSSPPDLELTLAASSLFEQHMIASSPSGLSH